jgi:MFS family permease
MLIGYDNGVMGGVINGSGFQKTFNNPSPGLLGTIVAIYEIGCCVGSLLTAFIGDRLGRRKTICLGAIVMLAGAGFQAGVSSSGPMIAARIVSVSELV